MSIQFPFLDGRSLPNQRELLQQLENGDYDLILSCPTAKSLLSATAEDGTNQSGQPPLWSTALSSNVKRIGEHRDEKSTLFLIGLAAFQAFLQSNVTGPPLPFRPFDTCFPNLERGSVEQRQKDLISELGIDGEAIYALTPHVELFYLARSLLQHEDLAPTTDAGTWARLRVNFWHQKMLDEIAPSLQEALYRDLTILQSAVFKISTGLEPKVLGASSIYSHDAKAIFLLERAAIHTHHGFDEKAREDLNEASRLRKFQHVLTGRLGKRTKFQQKDLSQLVVLAKSREIDEDKPNAAPSSSDLRKETTVEDSTVPKEIELNDDTILDRFAFASPDTAKDDPNRNIPPALAALDASSQPMLDPIDATILLSFASSITNTSPDHGLTREETRPYATRVIEGGSSNWQVYTQALLVRSRIEAHKSRTVERGVLQLQALVDQVIAETSGAGAGDASGGEAGSGSSQGDSGATTFLPRVKPAESAPVAERLQYIHPLNSPARWALEAELAMRWVELGGLRTALEIYERLEMWAEAAMCLAATDEETKAARMVRKQLYLPTEERKNEPSNDSEDALGSYTGAERRPLPADAPRLFCILGDLEGELQHYERAWAVSGKRYARAQRSLARMYTKNREMDKADAAYTLSLAANPQNAAMWFALGCVRLELRAWRGAVTAFQRSVQLEPEDGEAWSNLGAALVHVPPSESLGEDRSTSPACALDDDAESAPKIDPQRHARSAFAAFIRAAGLKQDSYRIWSNVLTIGASLVPPPYMNVMIAQTRIIQLRGATEGEGCVDVALLEGILNHIIASAPAAPNSEASPTDLSPWPKHGLAPMFTRLVHRDVVPLITRSRRLWQLVARLALASNQPGAALDAYERAWRAMLNQPGWDDASGRAATVGALSPEAAWTAVLDATDELVAAYESLGERETTEGLAAGSGQLVCANWRFKARSALRSVVGRRTKAGMDGMEVEGLRARMEGLKGA